jgi:glycosyltransferase involved in cell wall biosynthesis
MVQPRAVYAASVEQTILPVLSIIVPVYNEAPSIRPLADELHAVLEKIGQSYEVLWIDDASDDTTPQILLDLQRERPQNRSYRLAQNTRKSGALLAGFRLARGDVIVTMDGDGQDNPASLPDLLQMIADGADVAVGWRQQRADPCSKRMNSYLINGLASLLLRQRLHDMNTGFKAFSHRAAAAVQFQGSLYRFVPHLLQAEGFVVREVAVLHRRRQAGKSKFTLRHRYRGLIDMIAVMFITRCRKRPLRLFASVGLPLFATGLAVFSWLTVGWFLGHPIGTRPLYFASLFLMIVGVQVLSLGVIGTLIMEWHHRSQAIEVTALPVPSGLVPGALRRFDGRKVHAIFGRDAIATRR